MFDHAQAYEVVRTKPGECASNCAFHECRFQGAAWPACAAPPHMHSDCPYSASVNLFRPKEDAA
jgi:hypothetical protein